MKSTNEAIEELRGLIGELSSRVSALESRKSSAAASDRQRAELGGQRQTKVEQQLGSYWLGRAGIVALVTGIALFLAYSFEHFGTIIRVAIGYGLGLGLGGLGLWMARRYRTFGHMIFGGGLAVVYFTTYALHFVPSMRLVESTTVATVLLAVLVVLIVGVAHRIRSETVAGIALFLGLHTGMVSEVGTYTLISSSLLAAGAAFFLVKNRWVIVPASTLVAVYVNHVVWILGVHTTGTFGLSLGFLVLYYLVFSLAMILAPARLPRRASVIIPALNWLGFVSLSAYEFHAWEQTGFYWYLCAVGLVLLGLAWTDARIRSRSQAFQVYLFLGPVSLAMGIGGILDDPWMVVVWCALSTGVLVTALRLSSVAMRLAGSAILALATGAFFVLTGDQPAVALAMVGFIVVHERLHGHFGREAFAWPTLTIAHVAAAAAVVVSFFVRWVDEQFLTLALVGGGVGLLASGVALRETWYRLAGLAVLALAFVRVFVYDLSGLDEIFRIASFVVMGGVLLIVSYLYTRCVKQRRHP